MRVWKLHTKEEIFEREKAKLRQIQLEQQERQETESQKELSQDMSKMMNLQAMAESHHEN